MLHPVFLFLNIGSSEMVLIVFVALMLFGGDKLPQIAKGLGKGIRDFKDASEGVKRELQNQIENFEAKPPVESAPGHTDADLKFPPVENTSVVADPFAIAPAAEHETPAVTGEHHTVTNDTETASDGHSHADVSHLIQQPEVNKVAENHLTITHVSDDAAATEQQGKATT